MKALVIFTALVLGYSTMNMFQLKVSASTYKDGVTAYMGRVDHNTNYRAPSIIKH